MMQKVKIGLITIIDNNNYGNRLQNYAIQEKLRKDGIIVETIINNAHSNTKKKFLIRSIKYLFYSTYSKNRKRKFNFKEFNKNINYSKRNITAFSFKAIENYDFYIVGSDQVWNPTFGRLREVDLLSFAHPSKRIALSASFGIDELPNCYKNYAKKELDKFKSISVREDSGKKIVKELTGRGDVEVLIDPTMLLTAEEWDRLSHKPPMLKLDKYILCYFLGELSKERKREIERIARENKCGIIDILDKKSPFYECGPSEFLYLEKNAFLICTDSFHSSVFAILFNKPFVVFDREQKNITSMNSRLETLINKFKLKNRKFHNKITPENLQCDYTEAYKILREERKKTELFLKKSLETTNDIRRFNK